MERKDSDVKFELNSAPQEDYIDDEEDLLWSKKKKNVISRWFKVPEDISYSWLAVGCLVLVILFILIFPKKKNEIGEKQVLALETRIKRLEESIAKINRVDETVAQMQEQAKDIEQLKVRFDRREASLLSRLDSLKKDMNLIKKRIAEPKMAATTEPSKIRKVTEGAAEKKYHTVSSGETLYSISRQYGLTVEKIRLINKLSEGTSIHPGQELLVSP